MNLRRTRSKVNVDEAREQLEEAIQKSIKAEEHTPEVEAIADRTHALTKGNGFYEMFKSGLNRGTT